MGLTGKVTPVQAKKKWDNLKTKYKVRSKITALHYIKYIKNLLTAIVVGIIGRC